MNSEPIQIEAGDARLSGALFRPDAAPRAAAVIHAATGAPHRFYRHFAAWLAERGVLALTYDYSDFGASARGPARASKADMALWGLRDQGAALARLAAEAGDVPLWAIGHSLGGLTSSFQPEAARLARLIAVASGPAHWARHPPMFIPQALAFWHVVGPTGVAMTGALPRWSMGLGDDLPPNVFWQWRRWCATPEFLESDLGRPDPAHFTGALRCVALEDDYMIPPAVSRDLARLHPAAGSVEALTLDPRDFGLKHVGHIRAFARENAVLWPHILGEPA